MKNKLKLSLFASILLASSVYGVDGQIEIVKKITTSSFEATEKTATSSVEIYTKQDIQKSKATNLYQFLNEQTSIITMPSYGNPFTQKLDLRGYSLINGYENIVVNVDGRRMNNIDLSSQLLSSISLNNIEKIEILKQHLQALKTTQVNFRMCDNKKNCVYCPYKILCQKS